jgi:hypothetical protein
MTGSSTNNNTSTTRRASANNNNNAGVNALLVASGVSTTTGTEAVSSSTNNNNNISTSTSAAPRAPRAQGSKADRSKGSQNFGSNELNSLLEHIKKVLPTGNVFWELVAELHKERFGVMNRNAASIKKTFYKLANEKPGTGNLSISSVTLKAKQIKEAINLKAGV